MKHYLDFISIVYLAAKFVQEWRDTTAGGALPVGQVDIDNAVLILLL
jgi:hypothetical protein